MQDIDYKGVNTLLRTYELQLLTEADYERMLKAPSLKEALDVLKGTGYQFDAKEVLVDKAFEKFLMRNLAEMYEELFMATPEVEVVEIFSLRYTYHNLKVLLKQRFSGENLEHLLIPIGKYSLESLKKLVDTGEGDDEDPILIEGVQESIRDFEEAHRLEAATVFMDTYYFKHLRAISTRVNNPTITTITDEMVDLYNLSTIVRSLKQKKPRGFLYTVLSSSGTIPKQDLIEEAKNGSAAVIRKYFMGKTYSSRLADLISDSSNEIDALQLDKLMDALTYEQVAAGLYQPFGPLPLLGYLFAKEKEVTNIRLILVGKDNQISEEILRERMRPVYGS
ncbi:atpase v0 complex c/d subunit [Trichococcus palustris]|jgi:V/A-type H+/Na+-transporting ATPase subunit C|uniref:Atpase v0 complex c/d subunit n=1 Tax=Trichococcus palustris TaxID=140314 RepID=A0A143Y858_9LACT|nr:V-type ATPase subunit [Trichococcus palustris]CZQ82616.1 atpase v0 complex c/d subunit [Trichococcus palustris]SFK67775.1 V/A-type H+-transporting ATPase subunit C [Trichococcus palustris]